MYQPDDVSAAPPGNRLGVASMILGVVGVISSWLVIGVVFGIAALAAGLAARARIVRGEANNRGMATAGIVLGVVAIVVGLAALTLTAVNLFYFRHHVCTAPPGSPPC
jgi:Domain of unknown function (DUF4190)